MVSKEVFLALMNQLVKVLFVSPDASSTSGVGRCIGDLISHLDREVIAPFLVTDWPAAHEQTIISEASQAGSPVLHRELGRWFPPRQTWSAKQLFGFLRTLRPRIWALAHFIEDNNIDIVYTNALPCIDAALAARKCGRPHIWHLHETVCNNQYLRPYLPCFATKHIIQRLSSRLLFVSHQKAIEFTGGAMPAAASVVNNGVNLKRFPDAPLDPGPLLRELNLPAGTRLVVLVGIISDHKGHSTLVQAAANILQQVPNTAFLFAGSELDNYGEALREIINSLGISSKIFFVGPRKNIPDLLSRVDLLVLPSKQEAFPLVILEAMAANKPVVATRCGGPEEIVSDGETGYLVPVGDHEALADRILMILQDQALAAGMGAAGRKRVESRFSVDTFAHSIQEIILDVHLNR